MAAAAVAVQGRWSVLELGSLQAPFAEGGGGGVKQKSGEAEKRKVF